MDQSDYSFTPIEIEGPVSALIAFPKDVLQSAGKSKEFYRHFFGLLPDQTHSLNVRVVENRREPMEDTDALITFKEDLAIGVVTADCVPILIYAPDVRGVAAVHAGWKGTLGGIIDNTIDALKKYGANAENMIVKFGPSISAENYEVSHELANLFIDGGYSDNVSWPNGKEQRPHLDLQGVNITRMIRKGVKSENISPYPKCTFGEKRKDEGAMFPSYRRDGEQASRLYTSIMLLKR